MFICLMLNVYENCLKKTQNGVFNLFQIILKGQNFFRFCYTLASSPSDHLNFNVALEINTGKKQVEQAKRFFMSITFVWCSRIYANICFFQILPNDAFIIIDHVNVDQLDCNSPISIHQYRCSIAFSSIVVSIFMGYLKFSCGFYQFINLSLVN